MSKKIIVDVRLLSRGGSSGIEEYTTNLIDSLLKVSSDEEYLLFYNGVNKVSLPACWLENKRVRIVSKKIPNKLLDLSSRLFKIPKVETLVGKADLVFSPHFNIIGTKLPHVVTFHDLSFLHHPDFFSTRHRVWHWLQGYRETARRAAQCIAVSEFTKSDLQDFLGIPSEKITVIYSGIHSSFRVLKKDSIDLLKFKETNKLNKPFILYLGTLEPRKNIPALIRAFDLLKSNPSFKDFELVLAGRVGWLSKELLREARMARNVESIRFFGSPKSDERALLYNASEIFVYPSFFEGFGFQPLEAQACGVPVISSNRTSLPEILGESARLINPWSIEEIHESLVEIITNRNVRDKLVSAGLENIKRFSWESTAKKTIKTYNQVVEI
ncbi:MAG: glycosyltransferase family 1 protein [bacterium]|nr:glycosyltransferase family 1 protein [bacterium]